MATAEQVQELLDKMAEERSRFVVQARALSEDEASRRPVGKSGEEEWSAKEQLAHLWAMERVYIAWVRRALAEDDPDLTGVRGEPVAIPIERANAHTVAELLDVLAEERSRTEAFIRSLRLEDFERTARQPMFGRLTVMQWLRSFYRHDRMHTDQIAGREPTYRPRFLSGVEPDQRRRG
jgi:hypothetical protein